MNLSLRAKLRLSESCSEKELQDVCNRYYSIYKGILDSAATEGIRAVAASKLQDLEEHARQEGVKLNSFSEVAFSKGMPNINATVEMELASIRGNLSADKAGQLNKMIASLPHSAKRYYLSALVILQSGNNKMENYREAASKIMSACSEDPENPVYQDVLEQIKAAVTEYNEKLDAWQKEKQAEIDKEKAIDTAKTIGGGLLTALLWIGGALLTVAGAAFSCMCGMCDCC